MNCLVDMGFKLQITVFEDRGFQFNTTKYAKYPTPG